MIQKNIQRKQRPNGSPQGLMVLLTSGVMIISMGPVHRGSARNKMHVPALESTRI